MAPGINNIKGLNKYGIPGKISQSKVRQRWHLINKEQNVYEPRRSGQLYVDEQFTHLRLFCSQLPKHGIWEFIAGTYLVQVSHEKFGDVLDVFIPLPATPITVYSDQLGMHSEGAPIYAALLTAKEEG